MASLLVGGAGLAIGSAGIPGFGLLAGLSVGLTLGGLLFPPKQARQDRGKLDDLRVAGSAFGVFIPQVYGKMRVGGNMVWAPAKLTQNVKQQGGSGGLGGGGGADYSYSLSCLQLVCQAGAVFHRIWADDLLVSDDSATPVTALTIRQYPGAETQTADTLVVAAITNTPSYRGNSTCMFDTMDVTKNYGSRPPNFTFEADTSAPVTNVTKSFTFDTTNENIVNSLAPLNITCVWSNTVGNPTAGSLQFTITGNGTGSFGEKARSPLGVTWENWGVPPGAVVTSVRLSNIYSIDSSAGSTQLYLRLLSGTTAVCAADLFSVTRTASHGWIQESSATTQNVLASYQASTTPIRIEIECDVTGYSASGALNLDTIQLFITYTIASAGTTSGAIFSAIALQTTLTAGDIDVTQGTDSVPGYLVGNRQTAAADVAPLLTAYPIDPASIDGILKLIRRGGSPVVTIPAGDLGATTGNDPVTKLEVKRRQDIEMPARVDVQYFAPENLYQQMSIGATRYSKTHAEALTVTLPMAMSETQARAIAERTLYTQWLERSAITFSLPPRYLYLAPGDVILLPVNGVNKRVRILRMEIVPLAEIKFEAVYDDINVLTQVVAGNAAGASTQVVVDTGTLVSAIWSNNALRDADTTTSGLYVAAVGQENWGGAVVYISRDAGTSYQKLVSVGDYSIMGTTLTTLPTFTDTAVFDNGSTVDVSLQRGVLNSASASDILSGTNACLIGNEIVQFTTATVIGTLQYRLSGLLRGQRGTDYAWGSHSTGEAFVLLTNAVKRVILDDSVIGKSVLLKVIGAYGSLAAASPQTVLVTGAEYKPYAPSHVAAARDGSNNITLTWIRRTRSGGQWSDLVDASLVDTPESYDVEVWNAGYTILKRTFSALSAATTPYTAAQQTTDGYTPGLPVSVRVYQNNARIGRGYVMQVIV